MHGYHWEYNQCGAAMIEGLQFVHVSLRILEQLDDGMRLLNRLSQSTALENVE